MKKSILLLLVIGSMFGSLLVSSFMIAPQPVYALTADTPELREAKREANKEALKKAKDNGEAVNQGTTDPKFTKTEIKKVLKANDIDWINKNITNNFTVYYQSGDLTNLGLSAAHLVSSLFMSLNLYIIYPLFDTALAKMFDLTNITKGINDVFSNVQTFTKSTWAGEVFKQLLYAAFGIGLVWVFIQSVKGGNAVKGIVSVLLVAIIGGAWIGAGGTVLTKVNNFTSTAQSMVFSETGDTSGTYANTDDFQDKIRRTFFEKAVIRPYTLANFGTTNLDASEKDGSYRLIGGKVDSDVIDALAQDNDYLSKDGGKEWYQASVGLMAPLMSLAYGIPLLMIGVFNLVLQLGAILLYYLAPFTVLLSLLPKFSNSALKTALSALGLLFAKVGLLFGIMFVTWVGNVTDVIVPITNSASALLNSIVYIVLMVLLWKNKSFLVQTVTGSPIANQALDKISLTRAGQRAMTATNEMVGSARTGLDNVSQFTGRRNKGKSDKDSEDNGNQDRKRYQEDEQEMRDLEAKRQAEREERLADEARQREENDKLDDVDYPETHAHSAIDDDELPKYHRTPYLVRDSQHENDKVSYDKSNEHINQNRATEEENTALLDQKRREARSEVLKSQARRVVDDDKLSGRNFDEVVHQKDKITQEETAKLDKEL